MKKELLLIDANSLVHRAFHALPPLTNKAGEVIQAIYGVSTILLKLWKENKPEYAAALFDRPEPTFRDVKFADYKAQRAATADDLVVQLKKIPDLFKFWGIKSFDSKGFEADDLIATLAHKFKKEKDLEIVILTGDLDTLQLVEDEHIVVRAFRKGVSDTMIYNEAAVKERYGLKPKQMVDYKALVGDASDNIKGLSGVGPKTASNLLNEFGDIKTALKKMPDSGLKEKLANSQDEIALLQELVTLRTDAPVELKGIEELEVKEDYVGLKTFFEDQGFKTLLARLLSDNGEEKPQTSQGKIF